MMFFVNMTFVNNDITHKMCCPTHFSKYAPLKKLGYPTPRLFLHLPLLNTQPFLSISHTKLRYKH